MFKVDFALDRPIPWRDAICAEAGTVHVGGTLADLARSERDAWDGRIADRPFVLVTQPSRIEGQIERFAPGFRDGILARAVTTPADLERRNANLVGGDIGAGVTDLGQLFRRPTWRTYATPSKGLYLCSASTPPGVGVHGMCGYHAAKLALREVLC